MVENRFSAGTDEALRVKQLLLAVSSRFVDRSHHLLGHGADNYLHHLAFATTLSAIGVHGQPQAEHAAVCASTVSFLPRVAAMLARSWES